MLSQEHVAPCPRKNTWLHALARVSRRMNMDKGRTLIKAFIIAQFGYCPLILSPSTVP